MALSLVELIKAVKSKQLPENLKPELRALAVEKEGDWDKAHSIVQELNTSEAAWVHAYLHRKEGDISNASYWYSRAGRRKSDLPLDKEWESIAAALLGE